MRNLFNLLLISFFIIKIFAHDNIRVHPRLTNYSILLLNNKNQDNENYNEIFQFSGEYNSPKVKDIPYTDAFAKDIYPSNESIISGTDWEDIPEQRGFLHFYHPYTESRMSVGAILDTAIKGYLYCKGISPFFSNKEVAHERWKDAIKFYFDGNKKEAYVYLGYCVHLLEDLTVPAHIHNDVHPPVFDSLPWVEEDEDYESGFLKNNDKFNESLNNIENNYVNYSLKEIRSFEDIWSTKEFSLARIIYDATSYQATLDVSYGIGSVTGELAEMFPDIEYVVVSEYGYFYWNIPQVGGYYPKLSLFEDSWWATSKYGGPEGYYYLENIENANPTKYKNEQILSDKKLPQIYAEHFLKPAIEYSAGLIKYFYDLVNTPPIVESVTAEQQQPDGSRVDLYTSGWLSLIDPSKRMSVKKTFAKPELTDGKFNLVLRLAFSEPMKKDSIKIKVGTVEVSPIGEGLDSTGKIWSGKINDFVVSSIQSANQINVEGRSIHNYMDVDSRIVKTDGRAMDADPSTVARLNVEFKGSEDFYKWEGYDSGADTKHILELGLPDADIIIADEEANPVSVHVPADSSVKKSVVDAITQVEGGSGTSTGTTTLSDLIIAKDNLHAYGISGKTLKIFRVVLEQVNGQNYKRLKWIQDITTEKELTSVAVTPDATRVFISDISGSITGINTKKITLYSNQTPMIYNPFEWIQTICDAGDAVKQIKVSPDGRRLYYLIEGKAGAVDEPKRKSKLDKGILGAISIEQNLKQSEGFYKEIYKVEIKLPSSQSQVDLCAYDFLSPFSFALSPDGNFALITAEGRRSKPYASYYGYIAANDDGVGGVLIADLREAEGVSPENRIIKHISTVLQGEDTQEILSKIIQAKHVESPIAGFYGGMEAGSISQVDSDINSSLASVYSNIYSGWGLIQGYSKYYGTRMVGASAADFTPDGKYAFICMRDSNNIGILKVAGNTLVEGFGSVNLPDIYFAGVTEQVINFENINNSADVYDTSVNNYIPTDWDRFGPEDIKITGDGAYAFIGAGRGGYWAGQCLGNRFGMINIQEIIQKLDARTDVNSALDRSNFNVLRTAQINNLNLKHPGAIAVFNEWDADGDSVAGGASTYVEAFNRFNELITLSIGSKDELISSKKLGVDYITNPGVLMKSYEADADQSDFGKFNYGFRLPLSGIGYQFIQNDLPENSSNIGKSRLVNLIESLGKIWNENYMDGKEGFSNHSRILISDMSQAGGKKFVDKNGEPIHNSLRNGLQMNMGYFSKDGSDTPFEFVLSNNDSNACDNSQLNNPKLFDAKETHALLMLLLAAPEVQKIMIDPAAIEEIKNQCSVDLSTEKKIAIRGNLDELKNGSRRDMDAFMLVTLASFIEIKSGENAYLPDGSNVTYVDPSGSSATVKTITIQVNDSQASKIKINFPLDDELFKLYSDSECLHEIKPGDYLNLAGNVQNGTSLNVYLKILKESSGKEDIQFQTELQDAQNNAVDTDNYKTTAISVSIMYNETETPVDDLVELKKDGVVKALIKISGPAMAAEMDLGFGNDGSGDVLFPALEKKTIMQIPSETEVKIWPYDSSDNKNMVTAKPYTLGVYLLGNLMASRKFLVVPKAPVTRIGNQVTFLDGTPAPIMLPTGKNLETISLTTDSIPDNRQANDLKVFLYRGQLHLRNNIIPAIKGPGVDGVNLGVSYSYYSNGPEIGWHDSMDCRLQIDQKPADEALGIYRYYAQLIDGRNYEFISYEKEGKTIYEPVGDQADVNYSAFNPESDGIYCLRIRNGTKYFYKNLGKDTEKDYRISEIRDRLGNVLKYQYLQVGNEWMVQEVSEYLTNPSDLNNPTSTERKITINSTVDSGSNPKVYTRIFKDPENREIKVETKVDASGNGQVIFTYPDSAKAEYLMEYWRVRQIKSPKNEITTIEYQSDPYADPINLPGDRQTEVSYVKSITDGSGTATFLRQEKAPNPDFAGTDKDRLRFIRFLNVTDMAGREYRYEFNDFGQVLEKTIIQGAFNETESFVWDNLMGKGPLLTKYTDINKVVISYKYSSDRPSSMTMGREGSGITTYYQYNSDYDVMTQFVDGNGKVWENVVDSANGLIRSMKKPDSSHVDYAYNNLNQMNDVKDERGNSTLIEYNSFGLPKKITNPESDPISLEYDKIGNLLKRTDGNNHIVDYQYDFMNRMTKTIWQMGAEGLKEIVMTYDSNGNLETKKDEENKTTSYTYNHRNQILTVKDALIQIVEYQYDKVGNKIKAIDKKKNETSFEYDALGRLIEEKDSNLKRTVLSYNGFSGNPLVAGGQANPTCIQDKNGNTTYIAFDDKYRKIQETDSENNTTKYEYDNNSNLVKKTDSLGRVSQFFYDAVNRKTQTIDALGNKYSTEYDKAGNVVKVIDPNGNASQTVYDKANRVKEQTNALGHKVVLNYDKAGNKSDMMDARGLKTAYKYDARNRLVEILNPDRKTKKSFTYNGVGNKLTETDEKNNTTTYSYDALHRLTDVQGAEGFVLEHTEYDPNDNVVLKKDARGNETQYVFDKLNRLEKETNALTKTKLYTYDNLQNVLTLTDENSHITTMEYNKVYKPVKVKNHLDFTVLTEYDSVYNPIKVTDSRGFITENVFDKLNRPIKTIRPDKSFSETKFDAAGNVVDQKDFNGNKSTFFYDAANRRIKEQDALSQYSLTAYDNNNNVTHLRDKRGNVYETQYDELNRKIAEINPYGKKKIYEYEPNGNLKSITDENGLKSGFEFDKLNRKIYDIDARAKRIKTDYDNTGNVIRVTDRNGIITENEFDPLNRLIKVTEDVGGLNKVTQYQYDFVGNRTKIIDSNSKETNFSYDEINRLKRHTFPDSNYYEYVYDEALNVVKKRTPNGIEINQTFDPLNRLKTKTYGGQTSSFKYDLNGNLINAENGNALLGYSYDALNRLVSEQVKYPNFTSAVRAMSYSYDPDSNFTGEMTYSGRKIDFDVDNMNRLTKVTQGALTTSFSYDAGSRLTSQTFGNGVTVSNSFDHLNRLLASASPTVNLQYNYNNENIKLFERLSFQGSTGENSFADIFDYDKLYRVTGTKYNVSSPLTGGVISEANQPQALTYVSASGETKKQETNYDKEHNRINQKNVILSESEESTSYTVNSMNQYTEVSGITHTWDNNGNLTNDGTNKYTWDAENHLTEVRKATDDSLISSYAYDAKGRRIAKTVTLSGAEGSRTLYYYDSDWNLTDEYIGINNSPVKLAREFTYAGDVDRLMSSTVYLENVEIEPAVFGISKHYDEFKYSVTTESIIDYEAVLNVVKGEPTELKTELLINNLPAPTVAALKVASNASAITPAQKTQIATALNAVKNNKSFYVNNESKINLVNSATATAMLGKLTSGGVITGSPGSLQVKTVLTEPETTLLENFHAKILEDDTYNGVITLVVLNDATDATAFRFYTHQNPLGNVLALTDKTGQVLCRYSYSIDGKVTLLDKDGNTLGKVEDVILSGSEESKALLRLNEKLWEGRELDFETGLYYFRNRYYSPDLGRFISTDPLDYVDGMNLYAMCNGNYVNLADPEGLLAQEAWNWLTKGKYRSNDELAWEQHWGKDIGGSESGRFWKSSYEGLSEYNYNFISGDSNTWRDISAVGLSEVAGAQKFLGIDAAYKKFGGYSSAEGLIDIAKDRAASDAVKTEGIRIGEKSGYALAALPLLAQPYSIIQKAGGSGFSHLGMFIAQSTAFGNLNYDNITPANLWKAVASGYINTGIQKLGSSMFSLFSEKGALQVVNVTKGLGNRANQFFKAAEKLKGSRIGKYIKLMKDSGISNATQNRAAFSLLANRMINTVSSSIVGTTVKDSYQGLLNEFGRSEDYKDYNFGKDVFLNFYQSIFIGAISHYTGPIGGFISSQSLDYIKKVNKTKNENG